MFVQNIHLSRPAERKTNANLKYILLLPLLAQVDIPGKHGDQQDDGEAGEQPGVLDQEKDDLGGRPLLLP